MNEIKPPEVAAHAVREPDYSIYSNRDLCIALSKNDALMKSLRASLIVLEREAGEFREKFGAGYPKLGELGELRIKFLHAVRQIVRVREVQDKRSKTNHRSRAIKRGKHRR